MEFQIPECELRRLRRGDPPGNGSDAREKDIQFEGLGQVVVRAAIQSMYDIGTRIARGNDDHRRVQASLLNRLRTLSPSMRGSMTSSRMTSMSAPNPSFRARCPS